VRIVALAAALSLAGVGAASAQSGSGPVRADSKAGGLLMSVAYKAPPSRNADNTVRLTAKPLPAATAKTQVYIYKAPMATRPLKTW